MIGRTVAGKYRITALIGEGGMGAVYAAESVDEPAEAIALKLMSDDKEDDTAHARFEREVKLASSIDSPHVPRVFDAGTDDATGRPFMAMELLEGEELEQVLARVEMLPGDTVLRIAAQTLRGLAKAHDAGVIHRDIKPQNVFLARGVSPRDPNELVVKILDFGIAKRRRVGEFGPEDKGLTQTGAMMGSPLYMSPEQAKGERTLDGRTDIWSLGIVMYRALTGRVPHDDIDTLGKLIIEICAGPPDPVQELAPWVSPAVADVVERALEVDRDLRYPSAQAMLDDIERLLDGDASLRGEQLASVSPGERKHKAPPSRASMMGRRRAISHADTVADLPLKADTYQGVSGQTTDPGRRAPRRRVELYLGAAVVLLVAGAATATLFGHDPETTAALPAETGAAIEPPPPAVASSTPPPVAPAQVKLRIRCDPEDAVVLLDGERLGSARDPIELARGDEEVTLRLEKPGYRSKEIKVRPRADQELEATLERAAPTRPQGHPDLESPL